MKTRIIFANMLLSLILFLSLDSLAFNIDIKDIKEPLENKEFFITVPNGKESGELYLEISNKDKKISLDIIFELEYSLSKTTAVPEASPTPKASPMLKAFQSDGKEIKNIEIVKNGKQKIKLIASNISEPGEYIGTVTFKSKNPVGEKPTIINLKVIKDKPSLPFALVSNELKMDSFDKRDFSLELKNPTDSVHREIKLQDINLKNNNTIIIGKIDSTEKAMTLEPGDSKLINLSFDDIPGGVISKNKYIGKLNINDPKTNSIIQELDVSLIYPRIMFIQDIYHSTKVRVFFIVLFGAFCSVLVSRLSISSRRRDNVITIRRLSEEIQELSYIETELKSKLSVELDRNRVINKLTHIWTPGALDRLSEVSTKLGIISDQLDYKNQINDLSQYIDKIHVLPFSIEQRIKEKLKEANIYLYLDNIDSARDKIMEAGNLKEFDEEEIRKFIDTIHGELSNIVTGKNGGIMDSHNSGNSDFEDPYISDLFDELKKIYGYINNEFPKGDIDLRIREGIVNGKDRLLKKFRDWDVKHNSYTVYEKFLNDFNKRDEDSNTGKQKNDMIKYLKNGDLDGAEKHYSANIEDNESKIEEAISSCKFDIRLPLSHYETDIDFEIGKPIKFDFVFDKPYDNLNEKSLKNGCKYEWDFGDGTDKTEGSEVYHYFRRRHFLILFRKAWRKRLINLFDSSRVWKSFYISVKPEIIIIIANQEAISSIRETYVNADYFEELIKAKRFFYLTRKKRNGLLYINQLIRSQIKFQFNDMTQKKQNHEIIKEEQNSVVQSNQTDNNQNSEGQKSNIQNNHNGDNQGVTLIIKDIKPSAVAEYLEFIRKTSEKAGKGWFIRLIFGIKMGEIIPNLDKISEIVKNMEGEIKEKNIKINIIEPVENEYRVGLKFLDIYNFLFTITIACLVTAITYITDENFDISNIRNIMMLFSLGFGLDLSRSKVYESLSSLKQPNGLVK